MAQIYQLKQELDLKYKEIALIKSHTDTDTKVLYDISNKTHTVDRTSIEFSDTIKHAKPTKLAMSASTDHLENGINNTESNQVSMISDEDSVSPNSLFSLPCSRGLSPGFKENVKKKNEIEKSASKGSFRCPTISSQNKSRYIPIATSKRLTQSVERKIGK